MLGNGRSVINITISYTISYRGSNGREAAVTERAARSNPQRAVGEAHYELYVSQKVIDALLKALSTPWWTESSIKCIEKYFLDNRDPLQMDRSPRL